MSNLSNSAERIPLRARTDDNLKFSVTADYDVTTYELAFLVETKAGVVDLSQYCVKTGGADFTVDVPSSKIATLRNVFRYKVGVVLDSENTDFFFGGKMTVEKGISL